MLSKMLLKKNLKRLTFCAAIIVLILYGLSSLRKRHLNNALSDLSSRNPETRSKAIKKLVEIGPPSVKPLIARVKYGSYLRYPSLCAAEALGKISDKQAMNEIILWLKEENAMLCIYFQQAKKLIQQK